MNERKKKRKKWFEPIPLMKAMGKKTRHMVLKIYRTLKWKGWCTHQHKGFRTSSEYIPCYAELAKCKISNWTEWGIIHSFIDHSAKWKRYLLGRWSYSTLGGGGKRGLVLVYKAKVETDLCKCRWSRNKFYISILFEPYIPFLESIAAKKK